MDVKALTIRQPWASLIAAGVKTIETRGWSTRYRGPLAIHAGARWDVGWGTHALWHDPYHPSTARDRSDILIDKLRCDPMEDCNESGYWTVDAYSRRHIPLGAVVATCTLADVVPILAAEGSLDVAWARHVAPPSRPSDRLWLWHGEDDYASPPRWKVEDITAQVPFGDFTPGRYAWLLTDVTPLADPVPAKGRLGLWDLDLEELDR